MSHSNFCNEGIKKGVVELADMIIVNKCDGALEIPAKTAQMEYRSALSFIQPSFTNWKPPVICVSSIEERGFEEVWKTMLKFESSVTSKGELDVKR